MAKLKGPFQFTGKLGQVVGMKGDNGGNYVRERIIPANPRTAGQNAQRVKMSLAGKLSKEVPQSLIYGMAATPRLRRPAFVSNIVKTAVVTTANNELRAKISPEDVVFSNGNLFVLSTLPEAMINSEGLLVEIPTDVFGGDVAAVVVAALCYDSTKELMGCISAVDNGTSRNITLPLPTGTGSIDVYYIPVVRAEGATNVAYTAALEEITTQNVLTIEAIATLSERGSVEYAKSAYLGNYVNA